MGAARQPARCERAPQLVHFDRMVAGHVTQGGACLARSGRVRHLLRPARRPASTRAEAAPRLRARRHGVWPSLPCSMCTPSARTLAKIPARRWTDFSSLCTPSYRPARSLPHALAPPLALLPRRRASPLGAPSQASSSGSRRMSTGRDPHALAAAQCSGPRATSDLSAPRTRRECSRIRFRYSSRRSHQMAQP